jgi:hypothetical protein
MKKIKLPKKKLSRLHSFHFDVCERRVNLLVYPPRDGKGFKGFLPQLDEFYFTTAKKKILENCRCIVPNFMND